MHHSRSVADLALEINDKRNPGLDRDTVEAAAMLHDIGVFLVDAPAIGCHGLQPYIRHGLLGADLLRRHGYPEDIARVAERHTGSGIADSDILRLDLDLLPGRVYMPQSTLERLICYADKFYSKSRNMNRKSLDRVKASMAKFGPDALARFNALHEEFGLE